MSFISNFDYEIRKWFIVSESDLNNKGGKLSIVFQS